MKLKRILGILMSMMLLLLSGCGGGGGGTDKELVSLKLSSTKASVEQNSSFSFPTAKAIYNNSEEADVTVNWTPSKPDTSVIGTTTYTATYAENGVTVNATFQLTVTGTKNLAGLTIAKTKDSVALNGVYVLPATGTAIYDDSTIKTVNLTWDKEVITTVVGATVYTATYTENNKTVSATFTLTVKNIILTNLSLESTKGSVKIGNAFTLPATGTATYDDGTTKTVNIIWTPSIADTSKLGTTIYSGKYTENGVTKTVEYTLTVTEKDPKIKELKFSPATVIVTKNQKVTLPTTATAVYEDETTKIVTVAWLTGTTVDTSTIGTKNCVASYIYSYEGSNLSITGNYAVVVIEDVKTPSKLTIATTSASTEINSTYVLSTKGVVTYSDNSTAEVTVTWNKKVDTTTAGTFVYTAEYTENGVTVKAYLALTVTDKKVSSFTINKTTATVEAGTLYSLPTTGTITYTDGTTEAVAVTWDKTVSTTTAGTFIYTGSSIKTSKTVTFTLVVTSQEETGELQLADATVLTLGDEASVIVSANSFTTTALSAEVKITYDSTALQYSAVTLLGNVVSASKNVTTGIGTITLKINPTAATQLSGQIAKVTFKTLKSGSSIVKIGSASIVNATGAAYIKTTITDTATVTVGSTEVSNKIEISDASGTTSGEVELTVSATKFAKTAMGVDVILNYDTNYLDISKDSSGNISSDIVTVMNSNFMKDLVIIREVSAGKIQIALISMNGNMVDINGNIFKIKLKTKTTEGNTTVSLGEVMVAESVSSYITGINATDTATVTIEKIGTTDPTFEISDLTATAGSYVNVQLTGKNFTEQSGGVEFVVEYDAAYLTIESENDITFTNNLAGAMKIVKMSSGKAVISATIANNFMANGSLVNVKFKAASNKGTTKVKLSKVTVADLTATKTSLIAVSDTGNITIN